MTDAAIPTDSSMRRREWFVFLILTFVLMPLATIALVGGYGFLIWVLQLLYGPPSGP